MYQQQITKAQISINQPFYEGVKKQSEPITEFWQNVQGHILAGNVKPFLDHFKLPDLLPI